MKDIEVVENFLPDFYKNFLIKKIYENKNFPWYFDKNTSGVEKIDIESDKYFLSETQYGFSNLIFDGNNFFDYYEILEPLIFKIAEHLERDILLTRVRLGLTTKDSNGGIIYPHVDFEEDHKTFLYCLNTTNGGTLFFNEKYYPNENGKRILTPNKEISLRGGDAVFFDGKIYHSTKRCTDEDIRVTININFKEA